MADAPLLEFGDEEALRALQRLLRIASPGTVGDDALRLILDEVDRALEEVVGDEEISRELAVRIGWTIFLGALGFGHAAASYCREGGSTDFAGGLAVFERLVEPLLAGTPHPADDG